MKGRYSLSAEKSFYDFSFLPTQVLASAFSTFSRCCRIPCTTLSADFHVESMLLSYCLLKRIHDWHLLNLFAGKTQLTYWKIYFLPIYAKVVS